MKLGLSKALKPPEPTENLCSTIISIQQERNLTYQETALAGYSLESKLLPSLHFMLFS